MKNKKFFLKLFVSTFFGKAFAYDRFKIKELTNDDYIYEFTLRYTLISPLIYLRYILKLSKSNDLEIYSYNNWLNSNFSTVKDFGQNLENFNTNLQISEKYFFRIICLLSLFMVLLKIVLLLFLGINNLFSSQIILYFIFLLFFFFDLGFFYLLILFIIINRRFHNKLTLMKRENQKKVKNIINNNNNDEKSTPNDNYLLKKRTFFESELENIENTKIWLIKKLQIFLYLLLTLLTLTLSIYIIINVFLVT